MRIFPSIITRIADIILRQSGDDYRYVYDPDHRNRPQGTFWETDSGWSNDPKDDPKSENKFENETNYTYELTPDDNKYFEAVKEAENTGDFSVVQRMVDEKIKQSGCFWHGTPSGDLRGGGTGLHVGTRQAAMEALEARIGIPADGKAWDGTREYGKTLLAGRNRIRTGQFGQYRECGYNSRENGKNLPEEDFYPQDYTVPVLSGNTPMDLTWKPWIRPVMIVGPMSNTPDSYMSDSRANGQMRSQLTKGNAKRGYYYRNEGEHVGSISAVLPNGNAIKVKTNSPVTYDDLGNIIPLSQRFNSKSNDIRY